MSSAEYWKKAALLREIAVQEGATATAEEILKLYDEALDDINVEIRKIYANFQKRYGLDNKTAAYFLDRSQEEENLWSLITLLENAPSEKARKDILEFIRRDGLSVRAYAARAERYEAVKQVIYTKIKKLAVKEIGLVDDTKRQAYKESYYGLIDDTAKGFDIGLNFAILNDRAIDEAVNAKWHGKRFSERIWDNTDRLAQEAQELVTKALMSGESLTKTADKLAESFEVEKYQASTLIRTETSHIHAMADMKAYEDLGVDEYKYLATLDYKTCETCQPLDGKVFKRSEAKEGVNYPTMHPNCRCTTTININYTNRRARNPLTGKNEIVDGSMTYNDWIASLTDEQKAALELSRKKDANRTADKLQFAEYKNRLGTKVVGSSFDKWQNRKYNESEWWESLKKSYRTIGEIDGKAWTDSFKDKAKQSYFDFKNENIEMSSHAISRFLSRKDGTNGISYTFENMVEQCNMSANYIQTDGRLVKYYNQVAIVYNEKNDTVVSIVNRKNPKKDWREIK